MPVTKHEATAGFVSGQLRVLQKLNNYEFGVELRILRDGVNDNLWDYQNVEQYYQTFLGRPILCAYVGAEIGDGHNSRIKVTPQGVKYYSYTDSTAQRIVGTISEDPKDITLENEGGHTWIVAKGKLFAFYAPELVDKIVRTGRMDVSAETDIRESHMDGKIEIMTMWVGLGVTVLGDRVAPAIPGAHIAALAAMEDEFKNLKLRAASLQRGSANPAEHQETTHKGVKKAMAENRVLLGALSAKFPDYRVMAANDDGTKVCLLSKNGADAYTYEFAESDKGAVIQERIKPVVLSARYCFGENNEIEVSVDSVTSEMRGQIGTLSQQVTTLTAERDTLKADLSKMDTEKKVRNRKAAKEAVTARLNEINANKGDDEKITEDCVKTLSEAIDKGEYDTKDNPEECARMAVNAAAMEKQTEIDKKRAESIRKAQLHRYPWEPGFSGQTGGGSDVDGAFDRLGNVK